jgi:hypothetical protein
MPGTLATNGFVKADDAACCRVDAGIVVGDATLSRFVSVMIHGASTRVGVSRGQGGPLNFRNRSGYGK